LKFIITKEEILAIVDSLNALSSKETIDSRELALSYSYRLGLGHTAWKTGDKPFFSDRWNHYKFTLILRAFADENLIEYEKNHIKLIKQPIELQDILALH
jgi:hypothetical protein